jgi:hypothetical protein
MAPKRGRTGRVARVGGSRLLRLQRRAHKHARSFSVPPSCRRTLATRLAPAQPEGPDDMGDGGQAGGTLAPQAPDIPSLAVSTLPRQTPKVGAVCGNAARTVLCGGRAVMRVPCTLRLTRRTPISRRAARKAVSLIRPLGQRTCAVDMAPLFPSFAVQAERYPGTRHAR